MTNHFEGKVIPLSKSNHHGVFTGEALSSGEIIEKHAVGVAFMKPGSNKFRLKLYMFPNAQYFILPNQTDPTIYDVFSVEEYQFDGKCKKTVWNKVGEGKLAGVFITIKLHVLSVPLYLSLYPTLRESNEEPIAS